MNFSLSLKRLFYGQHVLSGLIAAIGVIGLGGPAHLLSDAAMAMALSTGVLCASLVDLPASLRHKCTDLLVASLGGALVTLLVAFVHPVAHHQGAAVLLVLGSPAAGALEPSPAVVIALLFGCVTVAHTFVTINYRATSIAACLPARVAASEFRRDG